MSNPIPRERTFTSFAGNRRLVSADLGGMLRETKRYLDLGGSEAVLIFEDQTGRQVDFDFRGQPDEVIERALSHPYLAPARLEPVRTGPGRPKLGVVSREVTLLPRHWEWLEQQPSGISAALRRLVDEARNREPEKERARLARGAAGKFMWAIAGNLPDFEDASRALYAGEDARLEQLIQGWPVDIRDHLQQLLRPTG